MSRHRHVLIRLVALSVCCALPILACGIGSPGSTASGTPTATTAHATPTPTPIPCATAPTGSALVWVHAQQVVGRVPASAATATISHFVYPLGIPHEGDAGNSPTPTLIAVAPDARHLAVSITQYVPFQVYHNPYIVDTSTHAVTRVPLAQPILDAQEDQSPRIFAWADNHTLIILPGAISSANAQSYDLTTGTLTTLPGTAGAAEGVVRCSTLFFMTYTGITPLGSPVVPEQIHRYNLTTHAATGAPITIGTAGTWGGAEGQVYYGGWDVSPDGAHLVYQKLATTVTGGGTGSDIRQSSTWFAAHADGSGAVSILPSLTANGPSYLKISPDGTQVAVTAANPAPNVASGPMSGGPTRFYDSPSGYTYPAWRADSQAFYASTLQYLSATDTIALYPLGTSAHAPGSTAVSPGDMPASLP
jgi:hypothetical protein